MAHNWNIPPAMHSNAFQESEAIKSSKTSDIDALFDSGYDSQTVSKTSIDLESDFDQKMAISDSNCPNSNLSKKSQQWTDSGLGITTDSDINIDEECSEDKASRKWTEDSVRVTANLIKKAYESDQDGDTYLHLAIVKGLDKLAFNLIRIVPHPDFLDIFNHLFQVFIR